MLCLWLQNFGLDAGKEICVAAPADLLLACLLACLPACLLACLLACVELLLLSAA